MDWRFINRYTGLIYFHLCSDAGHVVNRKFTTEHIRKRLSATLIEDTNQQVYRLVGDLNDSKHGNIKRMSRYDYTCALTCLMLTKNLYTLLFSCTERITEVLSRRVSIRYKRIL